MHTCVFQANLFGFDSADVLNQIQARNFFARIQVLHHHAATARITSNKHWLCGEMKLIFEQYKKKKLQWSTNIIWYLWRSAAETDGLTPLAAFIRCCWVTVILGAEPVSFLRSSATGERHDLNYTHHTHTRVHTHTHTYVQNPYESCHWRLLKDNFHMLDNQVSWMDIYSTPEW